MHTIKELGISSNVAPFIAFIAETGCKCLTSYYSAYACIAELYLCLPVLCVSLYIPLMVEKLPA